MQAPPTSTVTPTTIAAWWGAAVATLVFLWDIYKWRHRVANVEVTATANMKVHPNLPPTGNTTFILVVAVNRGGQQTTITHLAGEYFPTLWHKIFNRGAQRFAILNTVGPGIPYVLPPGQRWSGLINQDDMVKKFGASGRFYCGVFHSMSPKAVYRRVVLR